MNKKSERKYREASQDEVRKEMDRFHKGTAHSGKGGRNAPKVTSEKQAVAIGLSKARDKGMKVPKKKNKP